MKQTTPASLDAAVLTFCRKLEPTEMPVYVDVHAQPHCILYDCLRNVEQQVAINGGRQQQGWCVWYIPNEWIEAEFHVIWVNLAGTQIDITPKVDGETRILFLPSHKRIYRIGELAPSNYRKALVDTHINRERLLLGRENDRLQRQYWDSGLAAFKIPQWEHRKAAERVEAALATFTPRLLEIDARWTKELGGEKTTL